MSRALARRRANPSLPAWVVARVGGPKRAALYMLGLGGLAVTIALLWKNKSFVFNNINISKANRCFVAHDQGRNEVLLNYVSGAGNIADR